MKKNQTPEEPIKDKNQEEEMVMAKSGVGMSFDVLMKMCYGKPEK